MSAYYSIINQYKFDLKSQENRRNMEYWLLNRNNAPELHIIKQVICEGKHGEQLRILSDNFDSMIPNSSTEPIFAVLAKNNTPIIIYSVHKQHKLTRGLSTVYHTERIYESAEEGFQQLNVLRKKFEEWMVSSLEDGYKILGLNCGQGVFTPHQKYMDVSQKFKASL